jgi:hypothetical protein
MVVAKYDLLLDVLSLYDQDHPKLSPWERDEFLPSLSEKHDLYQCHIKLSEKQMAIVERIYDKCYKK